MVRSVGHTWLSLTNQDYSTIVNWPVEKRISAVVRHVEKLEQEGIKVFSERPYCALVYGQRPPQRIRSESLTLAPSA